MSKFLEVWKGKSLFEHILFVLLAIVNALFLFYWVMLALNYSLHFDDVHFMWKMREYSIFEYVREMYMTRGGNFAGYGINGLIFTIANWLGCYQFWPIIFYIIGILMVVGSVRGLFSGLRQYELYLGAIALYNVYVLTSIDVAVFLWLCAMGYYLAGPAICLLIRYINTKRLQWWQWLIYPLLVILLSGQTVALTPMALLIMFYNGLYIWRNYQWKIAPTWNNHITKRLIYTAIIMLCFYGIMVAAPGNYLRMQGEFDINQPANLMQFFKACAVCILICKPELKHLFAGILAVLIASFIRFEAAALVAILFCPLFVECCAKNKKIYLHLFATLCLVIFGYLGNKIAYHNSDWKRYEEYNQLRGGINDNPNIIDNPKLSKITMDDYRLFTSFEGDPNIVDIDALNEIKSQMNDGISWKHICDNWQALRKYLWVILCLSGILLLTSMEFWRIEHRKLPPLYSH